MKRIALILTMLCPLPALAGKIVVVKSADAPFIDELSAGFQSAFPSDKLESVTIADASAEAAIGKKLKGAAAILSVGPRAALAVAKANPEGATIACVPAGQADPKAHGATLRLQPPADGVIATVAWLGYRRVGFIAEADAKERVELAKVAGASRGLSVTAMTIASTRELAAAVADLVAKSDVLVVDVSEGLSLQDVQFLLRTSDQAKIPLIGTSEGFSKAGAPVAVAIDPRNVGAEAGRLAAQRASGMTDPRRFRVMVNLAVATRLGMNVRQDKGIVNGNSLVIDADASELVADSRAIAAAANTQPSVAKRGRLTFPPLALARAAEVVIEVEVKADGKLGGTKIVKGDPLFATAAIDSVKSWQFKPATADGKPIDGTLRLNLRFQK